MQSASRPVVRTIESTFRAGPLVAVVEERHTSFPLKLGEPVLVICKPLSRSASPQTLAGLWAPSVPDAAAKS